MERASLADFRARVTEAYRGEAWISEGNFASWTFDIRLPRAEAFMVLELSRWLCLWQVIRRAAIERRNRTDLPLGCPEQIDPDLLEYIWNFGKIGRREIEVARLNHGPSVPVLRLGRNREVSAFLSSPQFSPAQASAAQTKKLNLPITKLLGKALDTVRRLPRPIRMRSVTVTHYQFPYLSQCHSFSEPDVMTSQLYPAAPHRRAAARISG